MTMITSVKFRVRIRAMVNFCEDGAGQWVYIPLNSCTNGRSSSPVVCFAADQSMRPEFESR